MPVLAPDLFQILTEDILGLEMKAGQMLQEDLTDIALAAAA